MTRSQDEFMASLLQGVDSSAAASQASTANAATRFTGTRFGSQRPASSQTTSHAAHPLPGLLRPIPASDNDKKGMLDPSDFGPPKVSLSQLGKNAFAKPGAAYSSRQSRPRFNEPGSSRQMGRSNDEPIFVREQPRPVRRLPQGVKMTASPPRVVKAPPPDEVPSSPARRSNGARSQNGDDSFGMFDDDDAMMAALDESALNGAGRVKNEPGLEETEAVSTHLSSLVKRASRTRSTLWAERAKESKTSQQIHRSYIRCRVLAVRESTYEHYVPKSNLTLHKPEKIIYCVEKPRRGAQYHEEEAADGELPLAAWDGQAKATKRRLILREEWTATRIKEGDYIHCVGNWEEEEIDAEDLRMEEEADRRAEEQRNEIDMKFKVEPEMAEKLPSASPPASEFGGSDADLFAGLDEDALLNGLDEQNSKQGELRLTMRLLSSSPLSDSIHADNLLILHPDILVTATAVCDVPTCVRKPLVKQRINGTGAADKMSEALVMGTMLHEVLQACLTGMGLLDEALVEEFDSQESLTPYLDLPFPLEWYGPGRTNFALGFVVKQVKLQVLHNLAGLLCCGIQTAGAEEKLFDQCRPFGEFARMYLEDAQAARRAEQRQRGEHIQGLFRGANGNLDMGTVFNESATILDSRTTVPTLARVTHVFDVEEEIWSPMYGLKGKMDVSVEVELQETEVDRPAWRGGNQFVPGQGQSESTNQRAGGAFYRQQQSDGPRREVKSRYTSIMPMEIKTGRSVDALEHRAQTMLYTLMMSDRYGTDVDSGLLYYSRSGDMHRVRRTRNEVRGLIVGRNELAYWMKRNSPDDEAGSSRGRGSDNSFEVSVEANDETNTVLPPTIDNDRECGRCFANQGCMLYRRAVDRIVEDDGAPSDIANLYSRITEHLSPEQAAFYEKWERLLSLEEEDMVKYKRELWTMTAIAREEVGRCFANMAIDPTQQDLGSGTPSGEVHSHTYRFVREAAPGTPMQSLLSGGMSAGDPVVLSIEPSMFSVAQGYIVDVTSKGVTVGLDHHLDAVLERAAVEQDQPLNTSHLDITFRIDKDEYSDGMAKIRFHLSRLFFSTSDRDRRHRELIVDLKAPGFDWSNSVADSDLPAHLNEDQRNAMRKVLAAEDYALILGMPGTGKTTTIAEVIKLLVARGKTVLLASYTHSAVDTILRKLRGVDDVRMLRLGNVDRVHPDVQEYTLPHASTVEELDDLINSPNVIATTCLSTGHATFARRKFDYCIVDEASQITLPSCLGPLRFADKFVLVGDHFQLPPLVRNNIAREEGLDVSLFKRLSEAHDESVVYLTRQYRMNESIMLLSNHLIYDGLLRCGSEEVAKQVLSLPNKEHALHDIHASLSSASQSCGSQESTCDQSDCWLARLLDPSCQAVFVDTDDVPGLESRKGRMVQNGVEAGVIQQLARALVVGGVHPKDIAVITPYRQQLKLLQALLLPPKVAGFALAKGRRTAASLRRDAASACGPGEIEIMTADRSQGRDKSVVLLSLVRSNDLGVRGIGELLNDWRRINVALTRAQRKVVIVGSQRTLSAAPLLQDFFSLMTEQGWILKLPPGALDMHPAASREPTSVLPLTHTQEYLLKATTHTPGLASLQRQQPSLSQTVKTESMEQTFSQTSNVSAEGFVSASARRGERESNGTLEEIQPVSQEWKSQSQSHSQSRTQSEHDHSSDSFGYLIDDWQPTQIVSSKVKAEPWDHLGDMEDLAGSQQYRTHLGKRKERPSPTSSSAPVSQQTQNQTLPVSTASQRSGGTKFGSHSGSGSGTTFGRKRPSPSAASASAAAAITAVDENDASASQLALARRKKAASAAAVVAAATRHMTIGMDE